jgi:DNA repair protein RadA/Sms
VAHGNRRLSAPEGLVLEEIGHIADLVARFAPGTATRDDS